MGIGQKYREVIVRLKETAAERLTPRQQQYAMAIGLFVALFVVLYVVLVFSGSDDKKARAAKKRHEVTVTDRHNINPSRLDPASEWIGTAAVDILKLKKQAEEQQERNRDLAKLSGELGERIQKLESRGGGQQAGQSATPPFDQNDSGAGTTPASGPANASSLTEPQGRSGPQGYPPGEPLAARSGGRGRPVPAAEPVREGPQITRVSLVAAAPDDGVKRDKRERETANEGKAEVRSTDNYLPVSFTRGRLLGGLDAPTGGQAQNNPQPVMIQLTDNAILPNDYRAEVKRCLVVATAYGDISSERAYMRTDNLSCVRHDNSVLEVKIEGNVYGEDGKLGLRGRLVTKQGQLLANALRAGIVGGIGQGFSQGGSTFTSSPFGTLSTSPEGTGEQMKRGLAGGVGRALDNLANYYIRLAEQMFPVIEVDSNRNVDVALTKGVSIPRTSDIELDAEPDPLAEN